MIQRPPSVVAQHHAEDSEFILKIEGLTKLKCNQSLKRPEYGSRKGSSLGIPEVQRGNAHVDYGAGVRR